MAAYSRLWAMTASGSIRWTSTADLLNNGGADRGERHLLRSSIRDCRGVSVVVAGGTKGTGNSTKEAFHEAFCTRAAHAVACRRGRCCGVRGGGSRRRRRAPAREPLVHAELRGAVHEYRRRPRLGQEL